MKLREIKYMSDEEIEKKVREDNKDLPEGMYDTGRYLTGREGIIEHEIGVLKAVRDWENRV